MCGIFQGLDPKQQGKSIVHGAERIKQAAARNKESDRWSIAELRLSDDDIAWLQAWAASMLREQIALNLQYSTRSPKFGLLFLALAAEVCRRETEESEAWPVIRRIGWNGSVRSVLFNKQGAARPLLCHAIESACQEYGLRNILDQQDKLYWFIVDWKPRPEHAHQLIADFEQTAIELNEHLSPLPMAALVDGIAQVSPLLTGRLAREWLSDKNEYADQARALLAALAEQIRRNVIRPKQNDDGGDRRDFDEFDPRVEDLRLSRPFVDDLLNTARSQCAGAEVEPHSAENLQRLLQHQTFSSLVAAHLLETLSPPDHLHHVTA